MRDTEFCRVGVYGPDLARKNWQTHCDGGGAPLALHLKQLQPQPELLCAPLALTFVLLAQASTLVLMEHRLCVCQPADM